MAWVSQVTVDTSVQVDSGGCLWIAEEAVGAPHLYPTARAAWDGAVDKHADTDYPVDAVVALFWDWSGTVNGVFDDYGHIVINVPGQGLFSSPKNWGEHGSVFYDSIDEVSRWLGATYLGWTSDLAGLTLSIQAVDAPPAPNERTVAGSPANRRDAPSSQANLVDPVLDAGAVGTFSGWIHGENVDGNDVWFRGISGSWFWSGAFTSTDTGGLPDLNIPTIVVAPVAASVEVSPVVVPVETPPIVAPPVVVPDVPATPTVAPVPIVNAPAVEILVPAPVAAPVPIIVKEVKPLSVEDIAKQEAEIASLPTPELGSIIPTAKGRKWAYGVYAVSSLVVTNTAIGFAAMQTAFPAWLIVAIAVIGNLATPFSAIAIANAKTPQS